MILEELQVKCDNCKTQHQHLFSNAYKSYNKKCDLCEHVPLIDTKDLILLSILVLMSYLFSPINWIIKKVTGRKTKTVRIESDDGETYKITKCEVQE